MTNNIRAEISGIKYKPLLCKELDEFELKDFEEAIRSHANFIIKLDKESKIAISWWVSPKRTRSYPYARVYDTLNFSGKKVTLIPILKDEGKDGDRDFLQWDTISLMSLLGIFVVISYYKEAVKNENYKNKITEQRFDFSHVKNEIFKLLSYQSDALHWNLSQIDKVSELAKKSLDAYENISKKLKIDVHSKETAKKRLQELIKGKESFMRISRTLAEKAQKRESLTIQPKERLDGTKATITIKNYLGGYYFFTCDEIKTKNSDILLVEGKHTKTNSLPSEGDIKDGLIKMILFTNLKEVKINGKSYNPIPVLKLTTESNFLLKKLNDTQIKFLKQLRKEARINKFEILINDKFVK